MPYITKFSFCCFSVVCFYILTELISVFIFLGNNVLLFVVLWGNKISCCFARSSLVTHEHNLLLSCDLKLCVRIGRKVILNHIANYVTMRLFVLRVMLISTENVRHTTTVAEILRSADNYIHNHIRCSQQSPTNLNDFSLIYMTKCRIPMFE